MKLQEILFLVEISAPPRDKQRLKANTSNVQRIVSLFFFSSPRSHLRHSSLFAYRGSRVARARAHPRSLLPRRPIPPPSPARKTTLRRVAATSSSSAATTATTTTLLHTTAANLRPSLPSPRSSLSLDDRARSLLLRADTVVEIATELQCSCDEQLTRDHSGL